jgi:hypothetical protein
MMKIPLEINHDIVTLKTSTLSLTDEQRITLEEHIESILGTVDERQAFVKIGNCPSFILNDANLTREEIARLAHWRQAHRQCGEGEIHENCPVCEEGKRKTKGFKKNDKYREEVTSNNTPYHRMYADGYGGQQSFGCESSQGAKGGFVFSCPSSGTIKVKLYATLEQFPAILY